MEGNFQQLHQPAMNYGNSINPMQFQGLNQNNANNTNNTNGVNLINLNNIGKNENNINNHNMNPVQQQPQNSAQRNNSIGNQNDNVIMNQNFKFPLQQQQNNQFQNVNPVNANVTGNGGGRPMSRGDLQSNRIQQHQMQNAFAISNDQQSFQLPQNTNNQGNMQPQFHFIANQQKFYAQISPDKAPMLFSDKRPFTQGTQANGGNQQNERANSNNHSNSKTGRAKNQQNQNPMPYIQIASKTHTGSFPLSQMQIGGAQGPKYVSSASQLDQNNHNHLVSIFSQNSTNVNMNPQTSATLQNILNQNNNNHLKVSKIKPNKNNIKEKEQLYEDAIKLKIQSNNYREENIKLKTKIKILENEMQKKEKAMEEFLQKMSQNQPTAHQASMFYSPMTNVKHQAPPNVIGQTNSLGSGSGSIGGTQPTIIPMNNNFMASTSQKMQQDSFLVMNLKKQLKDQKQETLKKDEELELLKKNIKTTQKTEIEQELKVYQDELQRMRFLMEELMREGPNHPIYQKQALDKIQMLEQQRQQQDYLIKQLQQDNTDLANIVKQRDEDIQKKKDEKEKKTEMKNELVKLKKSVREKDKDILKLRTEISGLKKVSQITAQSTENSSNLTGQNISNNKVEDKKDQTALENQLKQLQKKIRDSQADLKSKKEKMDEQDVVIKKLQERLQQKMDELATEQKKSKQIQDEFSLLKKEKEENEVKQQKTRDIKQKYKNEIEVLLIECKHEEVNYEELVNNVEKNKSLFSNKLFEGIKQLDKDTLKQIIPFYSLQSEKQKQELENQVRDHLQKCKTSLKEACELEQSDYSTNYITFSQFEEALQSIELSLTKDLLEFLKVKYYERIGEGQIGFSFKKLFEDQKQQKSKNNVKVLESQVPKQNKEEKQKKPRPTTAKSNNSQSQLNQKSSNSLKQIRENEKDDDDEDYEEDFEDNKKEEQKKDTNISKASIKSKKEAKKEDSDKEPTKPDIKKSQNNTVGELDKQDIVASSAKKKRSRSNDLTDKKDTEGDSETAEVQRYMEEEEMLDIAEHCFIRVAEMLLERNKTARAVFTKYSVPEQFPDGTILELMSPIAFLEGVKEAGMEELSEMEAACLLRVLAKPELDNAIILNEFIMIMENFGVMDAYEDDDDDDDYIKSEDETDGGDQSKSKIIEEGSKEENKDPSQKDQQKKPDSLKPKKKKKIQINFDLLEEKGLKILQKLARFLLERYLHPREFFGPAIYKQLVKTKKRENNVDILQTKDFYLRLKIAGIRKTVKEIDNLNKFLCLDSKFPHLMQVKRVIKALEEVAQGEQLKLQEEMMKKQEEMIKNGELESSPAKSKLDTDEDEGDIGEDEKKMKRAIAAARSLDEKKKFGNNQDLLREAGLGSMGNPPSSLTGGPSGYGMGGYDYDSMMRGGPPSKIAMLMGFNHLNTIEEEKHETQNSNYFRDMESERDESKYHNNSNFLAKGSRILDDEQLYDQNSSNKPSPYQQKNIDEQENYEEDEEEEEDGDQKQEKILHKIENVDDEDNQEYEEDEDDELEQQKHSDKPNFQSNNQLRNISTLRDEDNKDISQRIETDNMDKSIKDMKSVMSNEDHDADDVEDYVSGDNKGQYQDNNINDNKDEEVEEEDHQYEEESDYEI